MSQPSSIPVVRRPRLLVLGPFLVDRVHGADGGLPVERPGGNGLVVASVAARLGWSTALVGQVADDELGRLLRCCLARHRVALYPQDPSPGLETKLAEIRVDDSGHWHTVATRPLRYPYLLPPRGVGELDGVTEIVMTGLCSLWRSSPAAVEAWLALARDVGVPVTLGLNHLSPEEGPVVDRLLGLGDTLFCNREEFCVWRRVADPRLAGLLEAANQAPGGDLVVSLGAGGVLLRPAGDRASLIPAEPVQVCSTLGAGDVLCAVTTVRRMAGSPLREAVTMGQWSASHSVQREGWDWWLDGG